MYLRVKFLYLRFVLPILYLTQFFLFPADTFAEPSRRYSWNMDTNPGWTTEGSWAYGKPMGLGGEIGYPDPASGYTGDNVYGYNLYGDYENDLPERHLTTSAIDCRGLSKVTLKFWRWLGVEESSWDDHAKVQVRNNCGTWTTVWENPINDAITDASWNLQTLDISSIADEHSTVYLRWTMGSTGETWRYCGWNIDDVEIWAESSAPIPCPECSGTVVLVENVTFPPNKTCECTASTSITFKNGVTFRPGADVTVKAPTVIMQPDFHASCDVKINIGQP